MEHHVILILCSRKKRPALEEKNDDLFFTLNIEIDPPPFGVMEIDGITSDCVHNAIRFYILVKNIKIVLKN